MNILKFKHIWAAKLLLATSFVWGTPVILFLSFRELFKEIYNGYSGIIDVWKELDEEKKKREKKKPEKFICNRAEKCESKNSCGHIVPHEAVYAYGHNVCCEGCDMCYQANEPAKCVPITGNNEGVNDARNM